MTAPRLFVDVLVVGLGPGGGSAACLAAKAGLRVLAVEKKKQIGFPVQCAEFIPLPMSSYAASQPIRLQGISGMKTCLPSGAVDVTDFPGIMINRQAFDEAIADRAVAAGAEVLSGSRLRSVDLRKRQALIATGGKTRQVDFKCVIAADGPHSTGARRLRLPALKTVDTRQYTVPLLRPFADTDIWVSDDYPGGYAWLFPKGQWANLGLGLDKRFGKDLKTPLDQLHRQLVAEGIVGEEIVYRTGGAIPVSGLREQLVVDNACAFVGDAAGLTHPITGAGISAAVQSGELAGQAVADWLAGDGDAWRDYEEAIRDQYETSLSRAVRKRRWLENIWHTHAAKEDAVMRAGWIAFDEYFQDLPENTDLCSPDKVAV